MYRLMFRSLTNYFVLLILHHGHRLKAVSVNMLLPGFGSLQVLISRIRSSPAGIEKISRLVTIPERALTIFGPNRSLKWLLCREPIVLDAISYSF